MYDIVIVGAGGCGRELYEMVPETYAPEEYRVKGFLSDYPKDLDAFPAIKNVAPIIGTIKDYVPQENDRFVLALGTPQDRKNIALALKSRGAKFISLIHPLARVSPTAQIGEGVVVYPFAMINTGVRVGECCLFNAYSGCGHDAVVGAYSVLAPSAGVLGYAQTGECCFLSTHAMLAPKKKLGDGGVIAANSAALRNAPNDALVMGVPGKNM